MLAAHKMLFFESPLFTAAVVLAGILLGLWAGSIAYTIAWRRSQGIRVIGEPSACHVCGARLTFMEKIPLISWFRLKGNCAHCNAPIGLVYPTTELLGAGVFASLVLRHGVSEQTVEFLALALVLMITAFSALLDYRIPNACIVLAFLIRVAYLAMLYMRGERIEPLAYASVFGTCALAIPLLISVWLANAVLQRDVIGFGTVKLVAVVGLYLGWQQGLICLAGAFALGFMVFLVSPRKLVPVEVEGGALGHEGGETPTLPSPRELRATFEEDIAEPMRIIPFAPSIIIALWVMLLIGVTPAVWNSPIF